MKKRLLLSLVLTIAMVFAFAAPAFAAEVAKKGVDIEVGGVGDGSASVSTSIAVENPIAEIDKTLTLTQSGPGYKSAREGSAQTEIDQEIYSGRTAIVTLDQYELKGYVKVLKDGTASSEASVYGGAYADYDGAIAVVSASSGIQARADTASGTGTAEAYAYASGSITAHAEVAYDTYCVTVAESDSIGKAVAKAVSVRLNDKSSNSLIGSTASAYHSLDNDTADSYAEMSVSQHSANGATRAIGETYGEVNGLAKAAATIDCESYGRLIASEAKAQGLVKAGIEIKEPGYASLIAGIFATGHADYIYDYDWDYWYLDASASSDIRSDLLAYGDNPRFRAKVWSLVKDAKAEASGSVDSPTYPYHVEFVSSEDATLISKIEGKGAIDASSWANVYTGGYANYRWWGSYANSTSRAETAVGDTADKSFVLAQVIDADANNQAVPNAFTWIGDVNIDTVEVMGSYSSQLSYSGYAYGPYDGVAMGNNFIRVSAYGT